MLIELMFYSGALLGSITSATTELKQTSFFEIMKIFDDESIQKLFNTSSYFESNNKIPNEQLVNLLDKIHKKITTTKFTSSLNKIIMIPEHVKYIPVEITQLLCLIKPKTTSDVDSIVNKLKEMIFTFSNPLAPNIEQLFNALKESVKLDDIPIITSIITPDNDKVILGIDESAYNELIDTIGQEDGQEPEAGAEPGVEASPNPTPEPGASPNPEPGASPNPEPGASPNPEPGASPNPEAGASPELVGGEKYKFKYLKYKHKYLNLKKNKLI
jgi:hypothetical protein